MTQEQQAAMKQFLVGLEKLTRETGIAIGGPGYMGGPWVEALSPHELDQACGYSSDLNGYDVAWRKDAGADHTGINTKTEQDNQGNNDDI